MGDFYSIDHPPPYCNNQRYSDYLSNSVRLFCDELRGVLKDFKHSRNNDCITVCRWIKSGMEALVRLNEILQQTVRVAEKSRTIRRCYCVTEMCHYLFILKQLMYDKKDNFDFVNFIWILKNKDIDFHGMPDYADSLATLTEDEKLQLGTFKKHSSGRKSDKQPASSVIKKAPPPLNITNSFHLLTYNKVTNNTPNNVSRMRTIPIQTPIKFKTLIYWLELDEDFYQYTKLLSSATNDDIKFILMDSGRIFKARFKENYHQVVKKIY